MLNNRYRLIFPNVLTAINLVLAFGALTTLQRGISDQVLILILIGVVIDGLDGLVARLFNATSSFGKQFDTLADLSLFYAVPAMMLYQRTGWLGVLPLLCGAIRLARFNAVDGSSKPYFEGLPTPMAALLIAGNVLFVSSLLPLIACTVCLCVLTISAVRFPHPLKSLADRGAPVPIVRFAPRPRPLP